MNQPRNQRGGTNKRPRAVAWGLAAVTVIALSISPSAQAVEDPDTSIATQQAAVSAVSSGEYTQAQWDLVANNPELADITPDPRPEGTTESAEKLSTSEAAMLVAGDDIVAGSDSCGKTGQPVAYRAKFSQRSLSGLLLYSYSQTLGVCRVFWKNVITSRYVFYDDVTKGSLSGVKVGGGSKVGWGINTSEYTGYSWRQLEVCLPIKGCYAFPKPWIKMTIKAYDGTLRWSKGTK